MTDNIAYRNLLGFLIMDNAIRCMPNGAFPIMTNSSPSFPSFASIASPSADNSHEAPFPGKWNILSEKARDVLGSYGGL
jgi:hypothetical protein